MKNIRKLGITAFLTTLGVVAFQPTVKALILDATAAVVKDCLMRGTTGLVTVADTFFWSIRILFVLVVVGIIYVLWTKRDDNENLQGWLRTLGTLIVGAGLIGAFETFFLGSADAASQSCTAGSTQQQQTQPGQPQQNGLPGVPGQ